MTPLHSLNGWDYAIIAFYFSLVVSIGLICRRLNRNPSDYFRGGGNMLWWVGAVTYMATGLSTWTFTAGAAKCYEDGFLYPMVNILATIPIFLSLWIVGPRFRRMRVITAMEAVFRRFGLGTEQFFTWVTLPMGLFFGAVGMNTLAVFMTPILKIEMAYTIIGLGGLTVFLAVLGGQWALSFFSVIQGVVILSIMALVSILSVLRPEIGGVTNLLKVLPERHLHFGAESNLFLVWLWIGWQIFSTMLVNMDMRNAGKFVRVKDDASLRKMAVMIVLPNVVILMPFLMQLPSLCAAVIYPDLGGIFPCLKKPSEGAWLAMAMAVLPQGLLGLMIAAMFGATADTADAALNSNAGFFVRNVYLRFFNPGASDKRQVVVAKITTTCFGGFTIVLALVINSLRSLNLFDLSMLLNSLLLIPMLVPMFMGIFIKKAPGWSGWSTVLLGLIVSMAAKIFYSDSLIVRLLGLGRDLTVRESNDAQFLFVGILAATASALWFWGCSLFWENSSAENRERIEQLFLDMARPVDHIAEGGENQDAMQYRIVGILCSVMGGFLLLCMAIPNAWVGRLAFGIIGGVLFTMGLAFIRVYRRESQKATSHPIRQEPMVSEASQSNLGA